MDTGETEGRDKEFTLEQGDSKIKGRAGNVLGAIREEKPNTEGKVELGLLAQKSTKR